MTSTIKAAVDDIAELKANAQRVLGELDNLLAAIEAEEKSDRSWLDPNNPDNWLFDGTELVGYEDREPLTSKYPWLRPDYDPTLDEL